MSKPTQHTATDIALYAVHEASGGPAEYVANARAGNWPIWQAAYLAASLALNETSSNSQPTEGEG